MCLWTTSLCEPVVATVSLALLPVLAIDLEREKKSGNSSHWETLALSSTQTFPWLYAMAGLITLTLAALVWRGREGADRHSGGPHIAHGILVLSMAGNHKCGYLTLYVYLYSYMTSSLVNTAWLLYVAGAILLFSPRASVRQAD